jgi:diguanylate cyclase (GGDEF)-like protein
MKDTVKGLSLLSQTVLESLKVSSERDIIKKFIHVSVRLLKADFGFTWYRPAGESEYSWVYKTPSTPYSPGVPRKNGVMAKSLRSTVPIFIENAPHSKIARDEARANMASVAVIPIMYQKNVYGNIVVCYKRPHKFTPEERIFCSYIGHNAAQSITINRLYTDLNELKHTLDHTRDPILLLEPENLEVRYMNKAAATYMNVPEKQLLGKTVKELPVQVNLDDFESLIQSVVNTPAERQLFETVVELPNKTTVPVEISLEHVGSREEPRLLAIIRSIADQKQAEAEVKRSAYFDKLTDLPNRTLLMEELPKVLGKAQTAEEQFGILFVDIDKFKFINDMLGDAHGDVLLIEAAKRMQEALEDDGPLIARTGGNEFTFLLDQVKSVQDIERVAERIQTALATPFTIGGQEIYVSASLGSSIFPTDGIDLHTLLRNANAAMRWVKETGGGDFRHYHAGVVSVSTDELKLGQQLRQAIRKGQLELYYEPQVSITTGRVMGAEALLRWKHPDLGILLPEAFLNRAEESGFIVEIGRWMVGEAARQIKQWQRDGAGAVPVSMNLTQRQLAQQHVADDISKILYAAEVSPQMLVFEFNEHIVMHNPDLAMAVLSDFKRMGCKLVIDNFGRGHTSLNYLRRLPVDMIKIDHAFIQAIGQSRHDDALVAAIISLAHHMRLTVTAEGLETDRQIKFLGKRECDIVQGPWFSGPLPADEFAQWATQLKSVHKQMNKAQL